MADIIPIRKVQPDDFPREMIGRFYDWLDFDNIFTMKALVRIISCDFYDLSKDRFELEGSISLDVGFEVQAEALAVTMMCSSISFCSQKQNWCPPSACA